MGRTGDDRVADAERSALDQHRGDRAAAAVEVCLDDQALCVPVGVGAQVERRVGGQHDRLEQLVEVELGLGRDVDEHRVAAVLLGHQAVLGQLATDLGRVRVFLVDLVDRDHDRHLGRLGVVERLDRLRHHTVVGRDHEDRDVGRLRTTGTHGGERLVTGGVDEGDAAVVAVDLGVDLVGTDVLGDASGLAGHHVRAAERVEELGLSVVDVTHDGHDRRPDDEVFLVVLVAAELDVERLEQLAVLVFRGHDLDDVVELLAEQLEGLVVDRLGRGHHLAEAEQHLHELGRIDADPLGEVGQGRAARQANGLAVALADAHAADRRRLHLLELLATCPLRLATATRGTAGTAERTLGLATATGTPAATAAGPEAGTATGATATGSSGACRCSATGRSTTATAGSAGSAAATAAGTTGATALTARTTATGAGAERGRGLGHHRRVGARHAGAALAATVARGRRTGHALVARRRLLATLGGAGRGLAAHALAGRERVVAGPRGAAGTADGPRRGRLRTRSRLRQQVPRARRAARARRPAAPPEPARAPPGSRWASPPGSPPALLLPGPRARRAPARPSWRAPSVPGPTSSPARVRAGRRPTSAGRRTPS